MSTITFSRHSFATAWKALYDLFVEAPVLGSLIAPRALEATLYQRDFESVRALFAAVIEQERNHR